MNYIDYRIKPLRRSKPKGRRPNKTAGLKRLISQKEASERFGIPALHIKWAIDAGRLDYEFSSDYKRRYVVNNRKLRDWARCRDPSLRV